MMAERETAAPSGTQTPSFEAALADLGEIVTKLESGALGLSESIAAYERGVGILRRLHEELAVAEKRVSVLVRIDEDGRPVLAPLEASAVEPQAAESSPPARSSGRGRARSRSLPGMDDAGDAV